MHLPRRVRVIQGKESKRSHGIWRRNLCRRYFEVVRRIQVNTHATLVQDLASKEQTISCREGCIHCCFHYVPVSLAHGILIVDYLYNRRSLLVRFLRNYERWYHEGYFLSNSIDAARNTALFSSVPIDRILADTRPLSGRYRELNIACPFLVDDTCFIYPVRPLSCSGHYSSTPPEWCAPDATHQPCIHHMVPRDDDLVQMVQAAGDPHLVLYELTLPIMIYRLLNEGSASVASGLLGREVPPNFDPETALLGIRKNPSVEKPDG